MSLSRFKLWVFDLDGTLIDSRLDLVSAVNATLAARGLPRQGEELIISFVGDGADDLIRRSFEAAGWNRAESEARLPEILREFLDLYAANCLDRTTVYPGARELLAGLAATGVPMAVLTNKPGRMTDLVLAGLGLRDPFKVVVPGDGPLGKKPDPAGLAYILKAMNTSPDDAVMVGDSLQDLRTARGAGTAFLAFTGGLGDADAVQAATPDFATDSFLDLAAALGVKA
jgi:phosphoglycolate phosphatase